MYYSLTYDDKIIYFNSEKEAYAFCDKLDEQRCYYELKVHGEVPEFDGEHWF